MEGEPTVGVDFADCYFVFLPDERVGELLIDGSECLAVCGLLFQLMYEFPSCIQTVENIRPHQGYHLYNSISTVHF